MYVCQKPRDHILSYPRVGTTFKIQSFACTYFFLEVVHEQYEIQQRDVLSEIGWKAVDVTGDGRCDSPGHSAQFGMYSFMDVATNKILTVDVLKVRIHFNGK